MAQTKQVTIRDIARRADVSISTVSRVLSGNAPVGAAKTDAVMRAIHELNYRPNRLARGLAGGRSMTIGVVTQNVGSPFYDTILRGIVNELSSSEYSVIFADGRWHAAHEQTAIETLIERQVDGLIMIGGFSQTGTLIELARELPLLVVARHLPELAQNCLHVDNFEAAYKLTRYLIDLGHRRIAHITGIMTMDDSRQRRAGYVQALSDADLEIIEDLIVEGNFLEQSGMLAVETLLMRGRAFSAIFAANDQMAYGARLALHAKGLRVPDDISLAGFDDQPASSYMLPPLTTIRQPGQQMGEAAAALLLRRLRGEAYTPPLFPPELVVRQSVARLG